MSTLAQARTFAQAFPREPLLLDERRQIASHHLGIGKTRKIIDTGEVFAAFYSTGYAINWAVLDRAGGAPLARGVVHDAPVAWGGGQFCVDHLGGVVHLVYTTRSRLHVMHRSGRVTAAGVVWDAAERVAIAASSPSLAAPWLSVDPFGGIWVSAVGKDGNFIVAVGNARDGEAFAFRQRRLFDGAPQWHHSCVQVLPYGRHKAVAVGFAGTFPVDTALVAKTVDDELAIGESVTIGACDVNDQITFHFQALGDAERGRAAVTYLGPKGRIDHATWDGARWRVAEAIVPFQSIAPQNTLLADGEIGVLCADYEGRMFALRSQGERWSKPRAVSRAGLVSISPAFARTGYGTGGIISAARSSDMRVPYLAAEVALDPQGPTALYAGGVGGDDALTLASAAPAMVARDGDTLVARLRIGGGDERDLLRPGGAWSLSFHRDTGEAVQLWLVADAPRPRALLFAAQSGANPAIGLECPAQVSLKCDGDTAVIEMRLSSDVRPKAGEVIAMSFEGVRCAAAGVPVGRMVDLAPYVPEPNSVVALDPRLLPQVFRRIL